MNIKDTRLFRQWFKKLVPSRNNSYNNENLMGSTYKEESGFFSMYHGDKNDIQSFLHKEVEMAEDGQAIYEFVQNAADSDSSHFYMFFDENYFMAINNGDIFTKEGIKSILNIGQSYGKTDNPNKIGRFGIGFKLVHRLVGKNSGLKELIEDYKGPQMFSWERKEDFVDFVNSSDFTNADIDSLSPWLLKILITNFPACVGETVKDINYNDRVVYPLNEVREFQAFLSKHLSDIDIDAMSQGTIFFIKLGENKYNKIKEDKNNISNRLQNSLYFLKSLNHIQINDEIVKRNPEFILEDSFTICPEEEDFKKIGLQEKRDLEHPFKLQFGYLPYIESSRSVIDYPNFYKYFPMEDSLYKLRFIFHSNVFSIGSNRRHLHNDSINEELLKLMAKRITARVDSYKSSDAARFQTIFSNIIASECTDKFICDNFLNALELYCLQNIPTSNDCEYKSSQEVIIKNTNLECKPSDFGINKFWLKWSKNEVQYKELISNCSSKLNIKSYTLKNLLEEGSLDNINYWIANLSEKEYLILLKELYRNVPSNICKLKFIRFDNIYLSAEELSTNTNHIVRFKAIDEVRDVLRNLGLYISTDLLDEYLSVKEKISAYASYLKDQNEKDLFYNKLKPVTVNNHLPAEQKKRLFMTLRSFKYLGEQALSKELRLFKNVNGDIVPLCEMINPDVISQKYFLEYGIDRQELFSELNSGNMLIGRENIYNEIIVKQWDNISKSVSHSDITDFYATVIYYHDFCDNPMSVKNLNFVFTKEHKFENGSNVFFRKELLNISDYQSLTEIIEKSGYSVIPKGLLNIFLSQPFCLDENNLEELFVEYAFSKDAVSSLLELTRNKVSLFKYIYFEQHDNLFKIQKCKNGEIQYYSSKESLNTFVAKYYANYLKRLPSVFSDFKSECLRNEDLYSYIGKFALVDSENDIEMKIDIIDLLEDSGLTDVPKDYIKQTDRIALSSDIDDIYTDKVLRLIFRLFGSDELNGLKHLITIDDNSLNMINANDSIELDGVNVKMSNLMTGFESSRLVEALFDKYKNDLSIDVSKVEQLFRDNEEISDDDLLSIVDKILTEEDNKLKNADQVIFIVLLFKRGLIKSIEDIFIADINGEYHTLNKDWYLKRYDFIQDIAIFNAKYIGVDVLFSRGRKYFDADNLLFLERPFIYENKFICPETVGDIKIYTKEFFDFLKTLIGKDVDWDVINEFISETFGWDIKQLVFEKDYAVEEEQLPVEIEQWITEYENNIDLLKLLGIQTADSPIVRLRSCIKNNTIEDLSSSEKRDIEALIEANSDFMLRTLYFLVKTKVQFEEEIAKLICNYASFINPREIDGGLPLCYIIGRNGIDFRYEIKIIENDDEYIFNHSFLEQIQSYCEKSIDNIDSLQYIDRLIEFGVNMIDIDTCPNNWIDAFPHIKELSFEEPEIDNDVIESAKEWNENAYNNWKINSEIDFSIYVATNIINWKVYISDLSNAPAININSKLYYWDSENKRLTIPINNIQESLMAFSQDKDNPLALSDFITLLNPENKKEEAVSLSEYEQLIAERDALRQQVDYFTASTSDITRGNASKEVMIAENETLRRILRSHLEKDSRFDCSGWNDRNKPSSVVKGITFLDCDCIFIVRSCKGSRLHLTPYEWTLLSESTTFMALRLPDDSIQIYGGDEDVRDIILDNNSNINLNFDSAKFNKDQLTRLSQILSASYVWGSGLVFDAPGANFGIELEQLSKLNIGQVLIATEDDI